jgi:chitinase
MAGLQWNQNTMNCDWASVVKCVSRDEEHEIEKEEEDEDESEEEDNDIDLGHETLSSPKPSKKPVSTTQKPVTTTTKPKPTRPPIETNPFIPTGNNDYMVVCYFTNWAWYRPGIGKYKPDDIDSTLCTHVVYGFAVLNGQTLTIKTHDSWADIDNNFYTKVTALKEKGIKVSVAIGGWNDSLGDKYSRLVLDPKARKKFIENVIEFMKKYDFQGLDLDWEYPVCWQVDCTKGKPKEKDGFTAFVRELHEAFEPEGFLLSAAVSPAKKVIDAGYDVPELSKYFDWIAVMCYDYHGQWDKKTGHVAPFYHHPESTEKTFNANFTMNYWKKLGADLKKLVMGIPLYGQSFQLEKSASISIPGLNAKSLAGGQAG